MKRDERERQGPGVNSFIVSMDNLTTVSQDESDFWCGLHTGSAAQARKLHSDNTLLSFEYKKIGLGTSLNLPTGFKPDALRRMIHVSLAGTSEHPDLEALWSEYDEIKPLVLGALYTLVAAVLTHLEEAQAREVVTARR